MAVATLAMALTLPCLAQYEEPPEEIDSNPNNPHNWVLTKVTGGPQFKQYPKLVNGNWVTYQQNTGNMGYLGVVTNAPFWRYEIFRWQAVNYYLFWRGVGPKPQTATVRVRIYASGLYTNHTLAAIELGNPFSLQETWSTIGSTHSKEYDGWVTFTGCPTNYLNANPPQPLVDFEYYTHVVGYAQTYGEMESSLGTYGEFVSSP